MKIFLDTAVLSEIEEGFATGLVDGLTTNPSLMKKAVEGSNESIEEYINKILTVAGTTPVSLEVKGGSAEEMIEQGRALFHRFKKDTNNVVIKIPINADTQNPSFESLKAIRVLTDESIPVNVTLIFTPEQALLAAKAGATYVSPFVGRIDDIIRKEHDIEFDKKDYFPAEGVESEDGVAMHNGLVSGLDLVAQIVEIFAMYDIKTQVLAASLRTVQSIRECAVVGADVATIPFSLVKEMTDANLTRSGMESFLKDTIPEYEELMK